MDGKKYMASRLATTWRRTLMRGKLVIYIPGGVEDQVLTSRVEHLGLLPHQPAFDRDSQPSNAMHPSPMLNEYDFGSEEDLIVQDPLSDAFQETWFGTAKRNREAFANVFMPVPNDEIRNWKQYTEYLKPHAGVPVRRCSFFPTEKFFVWCCALGADE